MPINEYLKQIKKRYAAGISTEHSYRGDLQVLLAELAKGITVTNEPKKQKYGAPDGMKWRGKRANVKTGSNSFAFIIKNMFM